MSSGPPAAAATTPDVTGSGLPATAADPVTPSTVAEMVTSPGALPVTRPVASTSATATFDDFHVTARSLCGTLPAIAAAVNCCVAPTRIVDDGGVTTTEVIGGSCTVMS